MKDTKKSPVKRKTFAQRKEEVEEKLKELSTKQVDYSNEKEFAKHMEQMKLIQKEKKLLATQEKTARENFARDASLYEYRDIFNDERYLVVGTIFSYERLKKLFLENDFPLLTNEKFQKFRHYYYETLKNEFTAQIDSTTFVLNLYVSFTKEEIELNKE
jgi:hypothetical protein